MMRSKQRGSALVEMTLVGIPIIFVLISIFEMSRGMWIYQTLAYSVKAGVRYATVHGASCDPNINNQINTCRATVASIATVIQNAAVGLDPQNTLLTFKAAPTSGAPDVTKCYLSAGATSPPFGTHAACSTLTTLPAVPQAAPYAAQNQWPPPTGSENSVGQPIEIDIQTVFSSALSMFWPESQRISFARANLGATSMDNIQF